MSIRKKNCSRCKRGLPITEFHFNKKNKDGLEYTCKYCSSERYKQLTKQAPYLQRPKGFPYKSIRDPEYIKDKNELFREHGNGWWWNPHAYNIRNTHSTRVRKKSR